MSMSEYTANGLFNCNFQFVNLRFQFQVGNVQVQTHKAQLISQMNSPCFGR